MSKIVNNEKNIFSDEVYFVQTFEVKYDQLKDLPKIREYNCMFHTMQGCISELRGQNANASGHTDKAGYRNSCSKGRIQYLEKI